MARSAGAYGAGRLRNIALEEIRPNPKQPRRRFDDEPLLALADSIRKRGVLQPVIVRPSKRDGYELIAGERRWGASQIAGLRTIPALVDDAVDDAVSLELALIENIARADLTVIEEARTIAALLDDLNVSRADLARRVGRSRGDLAHTVRLLELPDHAIELIDTGRLTKGHGQALLTEPDYDRRRQLAHRAAESAGPSATSKPRPSVAQSAARHEPPRVRTTSQPQQLSKTPSAVRWEPAYRHVLTGADTSCCWTKPPGTGSSDCSNLQLSAMSVPRSTLIHSWVREDPN